MDVDDSKYLEYVETFLKNIHDADLQCCVFYCLLRCIMKIMAELNVKYIVKSFPLQASDNSLGEPNLEVVPSGSEG